MYMYRGYYVCVLLFLRNLLLYFHVIIMKSKKQVVSKNDKQAPKLTSMNTRIDWDSPIDSIIGKIKSNFIR